MMDRLPDNIVWQTLAGPHANYTVGNNVTRCYRRGFPPIAAFHDPANPDFRPLDAFVNSGERLYCDGWAGSVPAGWHIESECTLVKMIWAGALPVTGTSLQLVPLDSHSASAALELATLTRPGPFTLRTLELGEYFGVFDGAMLVAMGGTRACAAGYSEISGVCTRPGFTGRGLARCLVLNMVQRQLLRGESPFLRVVKDSVACGLYRRIGFRDAGESVARTIIRG